MYLKYSKLWPIQFSKNVMVSNSTTRTVPRVTSRDCQILLCSHSLFRQPLSLHNTLSLPPALSVLCSHSLFRLLLWGLHQGMVVLNQALRSKGRPLLNQALRSKARGKRRWNLLAASTRLHSLEGMRSGLRTHAQARREALRRNRSLLPPYLLMPTGQQQRTKVSSDFHVLHVPSIGLNVVWATCLQELLW